MVKKLLLFDLSIQGLNCFVPESREPENNFFNGYINQTQEITMSKILQSLPMTVVAGVVLTIIMVFATNQLENMNQSDAEKAATELMKKMN